MGRNVSNLRYADDTTLMTESEQKLKSLLMKTKGENEKADLKLNIPKTKIVVFSPITSWQRKEEKVESVTDFIFLGFKITAVTAAMKLKDACSWKKIYDKPKQHILKSQDITWLTKVPSSQGYGFSSSDESGLREHILMTSERVKTTSVKYSLPRSKFFGSIIE